MNWRNWRKINKKTLYIILTILVFIFGAFLGYVIHKNNNKNVTTNNSPVSIRNYSPEYKFINPIVLIQVPEDTSNPGLQIVKKIITKYVNSTIDHKNVTDISVYFRKLNIDQWVGANYNDTYSPASMLKVATLIAFYKAAETDPSLLTKQIKIEKGSINENTSQDYYPPQDQIKIGNTYSTQDLLKHMIIDSDNNSADAIAFLAGDDAINSTFSDLKIPASAITNKDDSFTVILTSRLFRALYNGTYISKDFSEQALGLLSQTTFDEGLNSGVPAGIIVSHKFGERTFTQANNINQNSTVHELHDCGIIYAPNDPYFLCVMTKGNSFPLLQKIISNISSLVWNQTQK